MEKDTYDKKYGGGYLWIVDGDNYICSRGFVGNCSVCGKTTCFESVLYEVYVCSGGCNDILSEGGFF